MSTVITCTQLRIYDANTSIAYQNSQLNTSYKNTQTYVANKDAKLEELLDDKTTTKQVKIFEYFKSLIFWGYINF